MKKPMKVVPTSATGAVALGTDVHMRSAHLCRFEKRWLRSLRLVFWFPKWSTRRSTLRCLFWIARLFCQVCENAETRTECCSL